jgi:hypothetical protein
MKYSVWNNGTRSYNYFDAPGTPGIHAGAPPRVHGSELGATPDQAAWPLPPGAVKTGSGELPQGRIASTDSSHGFDFNKVFLYAAVGYFVWRAIK